MSIFQNGQDQQPITLLIEQCHGKLTKIFPFLASRQIKARGSYYQSVEQKYLCVSDSNTIDVIHSMAINRLHLHLLQHN